MTGLEYLGALVVSLTCMVAMDRRWRLFLWADARRGAAVLASGVGFFLAWDLVAIRLGMFERGGSPAMTGLEVLPHLPVEELVFVTFFCYLTMVLHALVRRALAPHAAADREGDR